MFQQPDLTGQVAKPELTPNGIPRRLLDGEGNVIPHVWNAVVASGNPIGTCRHCGHDLVAEPARRISATRTDYEAVCTLPDRTKDSGLVGCGYSVVFPNGRTGRWDEAQLRGRRRTVVRGE